MSTLIAAFIFAYNIGHVVSLVGVTLVWIALQHYWVHEWHARRWDLIAEFGAIGLASGILVRLYQNRSLDFRPWYKEMISGDDLGELKKIGLAVLVAFVGLYAYDDIIQLSAEHDYVAEFALGKIRSLLLCIMILLFLYVVESKWHEWRWFSKASQTYKKKTDGDVNQIQIVMDTNALDDLYQAYLTQAALIFFLIMVDLVVFQAFRDPKLDLGFITLLLVYVILLSIFKVVTSKWST